MERSLLGLSGEFLIAGELCRRGVLCSITYGASKSADLFALGYDRAHVVRIEAKTTRGAHWPVGLRGLTAAADPLKRLWILVHLPEAASGPPQNDQERSKHSARYFILTSSELGQATSSAHEEYGRRYRARHGRAYESKGIPRISLRQAAPHESRWDKVFEALQGSEASEQQNSRSANGSSRRKTSR